MGYTKQKVVGAILTNWYRGIFYVDGSVGYFLHIKVWLFFSKRSGVYSIRMEVGALQTGWKRAIKKR